MGSEVLILLLLLTELLRVQLCFTSSCESNKLLLQEDGHVSHLGTLASAVPLCAACPSVLGSWWFPGPLLSGTVVVEVPAIGVFMGLPVTQDVQRGAGGKGRRRRLGNLQLLEVGVDRRLWAAWA